MLPQNYHASKKASEQSMEEMLLENRSVFLIGEVTQSSAMNVIMSLLYLDAKNPGKEITLYINSPGGDLHSGTAVVDVLRIIKSPVSCVCVGIAMSAGALILSSGTKGLRMALPHSRIMIHQPLGGIQGNTAEIVLQIEEMKRCKKEVTQILSDNTGQKYEQVLEDCERDKYFSSQEAMAYGIIDSIAEKKK